MLVRVSNLGRVKTKRGVVHRGHVRDGYHRVTVGRRSYTLHVLIAKAFVGPPPSERHTVDHIDGDTHNNCASNLRWATPTEQVRFSYGLKSASTRCQEKRSFPIEARKIGTQAWIRFSGQNAAARELRRVTGKSVSQGNIYSCLNGRRKSTVGYQFRFATVEPIAEAETWKVLDNVSVSDLGRVRTARGHVHFGSCAPEGTYLSVNVAGKQRYVHTLVGEAFCGPRPSEEHTIDHINNDTRDNRALNLRWATKSEQVVHSFQTNGSRGSHAGKESKPVRGMLVGTVAWRDFSGVNTAARETGVHVASLHKSLKTGSWHCGWRFEYVPFDDLPMEEWRDVAL